MDSLLFEITVVFVTAVAIALLVALVRSAFLIWRRLPADQQAALEAVARVAVLAVEQTIPGASGAEKRQVAIDWVDARLRELGMPAEGQAIVGAIEAAVYEELNRDQPRLATKRRSDLNGNPLDPAATDRAPRRRRATRAG